MLAEVTRPDKFLLRGYGVIRAHGKSSSDLASEMLSTLGYLLVRSTIVASADASGDLRAVDGDFWFHTDGCFAVLPPRWVAIEILEAQQGGTLSLLDSHMLYDAAPDGTVWFGRNGAGIEAKVLDDFDGEAVFRYRRDYMMAMEHGHEALAKLHDAVEVAAGREPIVIGELDVGACLVVNNWRFLHRRSAFHGTRTIKRLWFASV